MNSSELFQKAEKCLIKGTSAAGRFHGVLGRPVYLEKADGSHLFDIDGREYIDYNSSAGAAFFGYNHPRLREAVERSLEMGFFMNFESEYHQELAQMLCDVIPSAEKVRLSNTGTEVTMGAIRLARAYTGRERIIKFEGHFHGMHECIFYNHGALGRKDEYGQIEPLPDSGGFPECFADPLIVLEANNIGAVEHAVKKYRGEIAAIIMEPISYNCGCMPAKREYLEGVREISRAEGIVLIFDEVLSGCRMSIGGAQEHYGVTGLRHESGVDCGLLSSQ
ncbi:MAG: aminotransferase class III-fold pyridoxal phosphate-dependent enzyme [Deltaproteobacteria bacterium]|nr:aminotransferase class III-fold pyridoxal phosphate-dependent enzyme [Deltaproteobacteria bacterium]